MNFFFQNVFLFPEIDCFFSEIGNNLMRALEKKHVFFIARPKSNARAHLKQRKNHSGLKLFPQNPVRGRSIYISLE